MHRYYRPLFVAVALLIAGCDSGSSSPSTVALDGFEDGLKEAFCVKLLECERDTETAVLDGSIPLCVQLLDAQGFLSEFGVVVQAARDGRVEYDPEAAAACLDALRTGTCTAFFDVGSPDPACDITFVGQVGNGQGCTLHDECTGGWCDTSAGCPGICTDAISIGGSCADGERCARNSTCDSATDTCVAISTPDLGDDCSLEDCRFGLICDPLDDTCRAPLVEGAPCELDGQCANDLHCADGFCARIVIASNQGDACHADDGPFCNLAQGLVCPFSTDPAEAMICVPISQIGESCASVDPVSQATTFTPCDFLAGLYCDYSNPQTPICANRKGLGNSCGEDIECLSNRCDPGLGECVDTGTGPCLP